MLQENAALLCTREPIISVNNLCITLPVVRKLRDKYVCANAEVRLPDNRSSCFVSLKLLCGSKTQQTIDFVNGISLQTVSYVQKQVR